MTSEILLVLGALVLPVSAFHATDNGGAHQTDLRLFFFEQVDEDRGVGKGSIGEQARSVEYVEFVY